jgi:hypothetical protein
MVFMTLENHCQKLCVYNIWDPFPEKGFCGILVSWITHVCGIWKPLLENGLCGILINQIGHVCQTKPL